jgi:hypothetical protein
MSIFTAKTALVERQAIHTTEERPVLRRLERRPFQSAEEGSLELLDRTEVRRLERNAFEQAPGSGQ